MSSVDTRDAGRDSLFLVAEISVEFGNQAQQVKVRNLSAGGMMAEGAIRVSSDARVTVDLRNIGPVTGTVVWLQGSRFGVAFDDDIDPVLARTQVFGGHKEAPVYARAALSAPRHEGLNGNLRPV